MASEEQEDSQALKIDEVKRIAQEWLAKAENPATGMDGDLKAAREKIKQLEQIIEEDKKIFKVKQQEETMRSEQLEKVIMMMAKEIRNLQESKEPELLTQIENLLRKAHEQVKEREKDIKDLAKKLENAVKENKEVTETMNTLKKVVESVTEHKKKQR